MIQQVHGKRFREKDDYYWAKCRKCQWNTVEYDEASINREAWQHCVRSGINEEAHQIEIEFASYNPQEQRHLYYERTISPAYRYKHGEQYPTHYTMDELDELEEGLGKDVSNPSDVGSERNRRCPEGSRDSEGRFGNVRNRTESAATETREIGQEDRDDSGRITMQFQGNKIVIELERSFNLKKALRLLLDSV
jgi:hypothetical protein